ncbi:trichohyalin [Oryzias latipes]|uniref:trichohyalin n=1 Tax=Oryzias latipes TaxID=8090 RepID=UPI000CE23897|nr:trichohyalin [Oryzias latipes]
MASRLVPEFPAVLVALEHLEELNRQLREDGAPGAPEASILLSDVGATVSQLEADRRAAHERLEVETRENGKRGHQVSGVRERLRGEVTAHAAAARAAHAEEMEALRKDLSTTSELHQEAATKLLEVQSQNKELQAEQETARSHLEEVVATLQDLLIQKERRQGKLEESYELMEELKSSINAAEQELQTLQQSTTLEREAFPELKAGLLGQVEEIQEEIDRRFEAVKMRNQEIDRVNKRKEETRRNLEEHSVHVAELETNVVRLKSSWQQCELQLEDETRRYQELTEQWENRKQELHDLKETFSQRIHDLQEQIAAVEAKVVAGRAARALHQESLPHMEEICKRRQAEENDGKAELLRVSQRLKRLKRQLDQSAAAIAQRNHEIRLMDRQVKDLRETEAANRPLLKKNKEKLLIGVNAEKKNVGLLGDEVKQLRRQLEEERRRQEEHAEKMKAEIGNSVRRYEELLQEKAALHQRQPQSADLQRLKSLVARREAEFREEESVLLQRVQQKTTEAESVGENLREKQREVEEKEKTLGEAEAKRNEALTRYDTLRELTLELQRRTAELELKSQEAEEGTRGLLLAKADMKAELEELRARYTALLDQQASELRAVEVSIYDCSVKLEQVSTENSRLRLRIRQVTEDVRAAAEHRDHHQQETQRFRRHHRALKERLQEAFEQDEVLVQDQQSRDGVLLASIRSLAEQLKSRKQQLLHFSTTLDRRMLDFSKRLGEKTTTTT